LNEADYFIETPLGEGSVNFKKYIKALEDIGYNGFLTIERETGENPIADVEKGLSFIKPFISKQA
jgi:AP endonuclease, family 2